MQTWLYIQEGTAVEFNSLKAKKKALFHLEEVFFCHMATLNELRCFIDGIKNYYAY